MKPFVIPVSILQAAPTPRGKSASKRQAEVAARLVRKGGKRSSIAYDAQALADIETIKAREGLGTAQEAVLAALRAHAQPK